MLTIRPIYDEIMADLCQKGFGGLVQSIDHDYKNENLGRKYTTSPTQKNESIKNKNEVDIPRPAVGTGGPNSHYTRWI